MVSPYTIGPYLDVLAQPSKGLKDSSAGVSTTSSSIKSSNASLASGLAPSKTLVANADDAVGSIFAVSTAGIGFTIFFEADTVAASRNTGTFL